MKKKILFAIGLFILPMLMEAKTVTCTTTTNLEVGKEVGSAFKVRCSEGTVEPFAVTVKGSGYIFSDDLAESGKVYFLDFVWTGKLEEGDKIVVDGQDQSDFAILCDDGCHLSTKEVTAKATTPTTPTTPTNPTPTTPSTPTTDPKPTTTTVYWVSFDTNGGKETIKQQAVEEGKTATKPTDPTREGYKFVEWQLDGKKYDFGNKITKSITLKAKWEEDTAGKTKISFVKLTGILAPYEGDLLDTSVTIETFKPWTIDMFSVDMKWYRGKDKNKITEGVTSAHKHKAEAGYYYKLVITLTPGEGYTFNNPKIKVSGKTTTYTKDENRIVLAEKVYGPLKKGEKSDPLLTIEDVYDTVGGGRDTHFSVMAVMIEHDPDADSVTLGPNCIRVTNTRDFEISNEICGTDSIKTNYSKMYMKNDLKPLATLTLKNAVPGNTYKTDIILTDTKGRTYIATWTFLAVSHGKVTVGSQGDPVIAEFQGEVEKNWYVHVESIKDTSTYLPPQNNLSLQELGNYIDIQNITITSEDGEKTNGTFTLRIKLTDELKKYGKFTFVYVAGGDGYAYSTTDEKVEGHVEGDYLVVKLPHLSAYAIYGNNNEVKAVKNNTLMYIIIGCSVIVLAGVAFVIIKKKKN